MRLSNCLPFKKKKTQHNAIQLLNFLNSGCHVIFSNESKALSHFIKGPWSKVYSKYQNLDEMKIHLHSQINRQLASSLNTIEIAGFNHFHKTGNHWVSESHRYGRIYISFDSSAVRVVA